MVTVPALDEQTDRRRDAIAPLKARCSKAGVTHDVIAEALVVTRPYIVNVFAGRKRATEDFVKGATALCDKAERRAKSKAS